MSQYGYVTETRDAHRGRRRDRRREDFALADGRHDDALRGTVTDGSGHDWPLYAKVAVEGPAPDVYTDPETGAYSVQVPDDATYAITVTAEYPGYDVRDRGGRGRRRRPRTTSRLTVDDSTCTAPGYVFNTEGITEAFDAGTLPAGWTIVDNKGNGQVWRFDDPSEPGQPHRRHGRFAIMDSDFYGSAGAAGHLAGHARRST